MKIEISHVEAETIIQALTNERRRLIKKGMEAKMSKAERHNHSLRKEIIADTLRGFRAKVEMAQ